MLDSLISTPQISVIVPVYNVEIYLEKCLTSIINQTYKELEIIVINDGSTDSSGLICEEYALLDPRIKVFHQSNSGISVVRNRGIDISTGKYVILVDSDDYLNLNFIELLYEAMISSNAQISIGHLKTVALDGSFIPSRGKNLGNHVHQFTPYESVRAMYHHQYSYSLSFVVVTGKIYEASLFEGLRFPVGKAYDDEFINYQLLLRSSKIVFVPNSIYNYLIRPGSLTRLEYSLSKLDRLSALEERMEIFSHFGMQSLVHLTQYFYFRDLSVNIRNMARYFPQKFEIRNSLGSKLKNSGRILLLSKPISLRSYLFIASSLLKYNFSILRKNCFAFMIK